MARIDWTRDEPVLACALVAEKEWRGLRTTDQQVQDPSRLLRRLPLHGGAAADPKFRSLGSVSLKTGNIMTAK
ncbi:hypothetical protein [Streptomyces sp. NPDC048489]|uniref:hypothetical protein n=1 Tax=Streptomyces sp. NPDC048489 TaxID=3154504 RepID=UPI00341BE78E